MSGRVQVFFDGGWWSLPEYVKTVEHVMWLGMTPLDVPGAAWETFVMPRYFAVRMEPAQ